MVRHPQENFTERHDTIRPELVRDIESLNLDAIQKGDILFVVVGLKPSAYISFDARIWHEGETPHVLKTEKDIEALCRVIQYSGLPFTLLPRRIRTEKQAINKRKVTVFHDGVEVLIGQTKAKLQNLTDALTSKDHERVGGALGIPVTATEVFSGKRKRLNLYTVPKDILMSEAFIFAPTPTLSKDNWESEIEEGKRRASILKSISPVLYEAVRQERLRGYEQQGLLDDKVRRKWSVKNL